MTEKRFTKQEIYDGVNRYQINESNFIVEILDEGIPMHYSTIVNRLNKQHETIIKLEKENEQLKQFHEKVFSLFDKEIAQNEEAIEWGKEVGADTGSMGFYNHMLKKFKKELEE